MSAAAELTLGDGVRIPQIGFGTFQIPPDATQQAVERALELGYRLVDTAAAYYNEAEVGAALRAYGGDDVVVTTKLRNADQGYDSALAAFESSRRALGVDVVDLYLIHWPVPSQDRYVDCWRALIKLRDDGLVRSIGVSNFLAERRGGLDRDPQLRAGLPQPRLREARMDLQLIDRRRHAGLVDDPAQVLGEEVGDADRAHEPFLLQLDERLPRLDVVIVRGDGPVDQIEVEMAQLEPLEARATGALGLLESLIFVPALRRDEQLVARNARCAQR